ncbi:MAG: octaprenyl-diphosphate synthase [Sphingobacteriales bacterium]|jgi:octaprenyl-diphosphate synthase
MQTLDKIKSPIKGELDVFETKFREAMRSKTPLLDKITHYIVKRKGKQIRPILVFFSAKLCGEITESTHRAAALIELLHTATLVHDDVVDDAYQRRGFFSINALWKNKIAVLVGDFLLSKGLLLSLENDEFALLKVVSTAVREMSEGELLQVEKARSFNLQEDVYFDVIRQKTASLFAACCAAGAISSGANDEVVKKMEALGTQIGMAFQLKDDIFEFGTDDIGKPKGTDIKEKKATLPLIYALNNASSAEKKRIIKLIKSESNSVNDINEVIRFVNEKGGVDYSETVMNTYIDKALELLKDIGQNEVSESFKELILYTTKRKK